VEQQVKNFSKILFHGVVIGGLICLLAGPGCRQHSESKATEGETTMLEGRQRITVGNTPLFVEVVQTDEERMRGLMFREHLPEDQGMLFVFEVSRIQSFWMRNTFIPLDIAFIDSEGKIVDIQHMVPLDESKSYVSAAPALYVLEVNAGWFERHGVKVGERVKF